MGGYAFSQGLEYAVECGWVSDFTRAHEWLSAQIEYSLATVDLPLLLRSFHGAQKNCSSQVSYYNAMALACRETRELRLTDTAMGEALWRVLKPMSVPRICDEKEQSFLIGFAAAANHWGIDSRQMLLGYGWSWLENQVAGATKLIPLGQTQAQKLLSDLQPVLLAACERAQVLDDEDIGASLPALAIASALHETQYTRLFRS